MRNKPDGAYTSPDNAEYGTAYYVVDPSGLSQGEYYIYTIGAGDKAMQIAYCQTSKKAYIRFQWGGFWAWGTGWKQISWT